MATTTKIEITKTWQQISDSDCTIQAKNTTILFDIAVSATEPTDAWIEMRLVEPVNIAYETPVWCRINEHQLSDKSETINIIK